MSAALALLLLVGSAAPSVSPMEDGQALYLDLEFELAAARFREASRDPSLTDAERATAYAWLGIAYTQVADPMSAREAFLEAIKLDRDVQLPPEASAPPKAVALFEDSRAESPPEEEVTAPPPPLVEEPAADQSVSGLSAPLVSIAQYALGVGAFGACAALSCGPLCVLPCATAPLGLPVVGVIAGAMAQTLLCTGAGAASGAAQASFGDLVGRERAGLLWPTVTGAASGLLFGAGFASLSAIPFLFDPAYSPLADPSNPASVLIANANPSGIVVFAALGLCTGACALVPLAATIAYALTSTPKVLDDADRPEQSPASAHADAPLLQSATLAMYY